MRRRKIQKALLDLANYEEHVHFKPTSLLNAVKEDLPARETIIVAVERDASEITITVESLVTQWREAVNVVLESSPSLFGGEIDLSLPENNTIWKLTETPKPASSWGIGWEIGVPLEEVVLGLIKKRIAAVADKPSGAKGPADWLLVRGENWLAAMEQIKYKKLSERHNSLPGPSKKTVPGHSKKESLLDKLPLTRWLRKG